MRKFLSFSFIILFSLISMHITAQNFNGNKEDIDIILKSKKDFSINFMNRDFEKVTNRYTRDGKIFPNEY